MVAVNVFPDDTSEELQILKVKSVEMGAVAAVLSSPYREGGAGAEELASAVLAVCAQPCTCRLLYDLNVSIEEKIETIARFMYGASGVEFSSKARADILTATRLGPGP